MMGSKFLVVGTGRAGQARLKSFHSMPHTTVDSLAARDSDFAAKYQACLAQPDLTGVLICTGNDSHYELAYDALVAGKHTLVEFPLCRTYSDAKRLYELAEQSNCVLHVEFVGLMTGSHRAMQTVPVHTIAAIQVDMSGGYYRWVKSDAETGHIGSLLVGRLQALHDLVGPLTLQDVQCSQSGEGYDVRVTLMGMGGVQIHLRDRRADECPRRRTMEVLDHEGAPISPSSLPSTVGLFDADLQLFQDRIRDEASAKLIATNSDVLTVMALADRISEQCRMTSRMLRP